MIFVFINVIAYINAPLWDCSLSYNRFNRIMATL